MLYNCEKITTDVNKVRYKMNANLINLIVKEIIINPFKSIYDGISFSTLKNLIDCLKKNDDNYIKLFYKHKGNKVNKIFI